MQTKHSALQSFTWVAALLCLLPCARLFIIYTAAPTAIPAMHALVYLTVLFALLFGCFAFLRKKLRLIPDRLTALLLALAVLLWAQGNLFLWNYGELDGRPLRFSSYHWHGVAELVLWIVVLGAAWFRPAAWRAKAVPIAMVLLVTQLVAIGNAWVDMPSQWFKRYRLDETHYYHYSAKRNIIVIILDAARSDVFQQIVTETPKWRNVFSGFTFFQNTTGSFNSTNPSLSGILTGKVFDNRDSYEVAYARMFTSGDSLPFRLKEAGFLTEIYPYNNSSVYLTPAVVTNAVKQHTPWSFAEMRQLGSLGRVAAFNFSPHFVKTFLFSAENSYQFAPPPAVSKEAENKAYSKLDEGARMHLLVQREQIERFGSDFTQFDLDKDLFRLMHFHGAHPPFIHDEQFRDAPMPFSLRSYKKQLAGALMTPEALIASLKREGKYDDTMLIIIGDHGLYIPDGAGSRPSEGILDHHEVDANLPLLMIKPFGPTRGPLKISRAPVSLFDIPATVLDALGLKHHTGKPVFSVKENEARKRLSYSLILSKRSKVDEVGLFEFEIDGHAWDLNAWKPSGRYFPPMTGPMPLSEETLKEMLVEHRAFLDDTARFIQHGR